MPSIPWHFSVEIRSSNIHYRWAQGCNAEHFNRLNNTSLASSVVPRPWGAASNDSSPFDLSRVMSDTESFIHLIRPLLKLPHPSSYFRLSLPLISACLLYEMEQQSLMKAWKLLQLLWRSWGILLLLGLKRHSQLSFPEMTQESLWKYSCNSWRPRKTWGKASEEVCPCLQPGHSWTVVQAGQIFPFPSWFIYPEWQAVRRLYLGWPHSNWNRQSHIISHYKK